MKSFVENQYGTSVSNFYLKFLKISQPSKKTFLNGKNKTILICFIS